MKFTKLALTLLCCGVLFCGCAKDNSAAIKVNDHIITKGEFNSEFKKIRNIQLKNAPKEIKREDSYVSLAIKSKFVNDSIIRELLHQEFDKRKITASLEEIKAKKETMIKQFPSKEAFDKVLRENGISEEKLNTDMASEVKVEKLIAQLYDGKVSDSEVEKFYKENKKDFTMPETVQAAHILFETNKEAIRRSIVDADKDAKLSQEEIDKKVSEEYAKTQGLIKEVRQKAVNNPKAFADLAKEYSIDKGSAANGGDLGYFVREQMVKEFSDAAFSQKVGTISKPVESQFGTHLIYVKDKKAASVQSFSEVKNDLKQFLINKHKFEALQKLINGLRFSAKIEYVDETLKPEYIQKQIDETLAKQNPAFKKEQKDKKEK